MARMIEAAMRGYQFVDNIQRQHRADARLETLQGREDVQWQQGQEDRVEKKTDEKLSKDAAYNIALAMMPPETPEAEKPNVLSKLTTDLENPEKTANTLSKWNEIEYHLNRGKTPPSDLVLEYLNEGLGETEIASRAAKNGITGAKLAGIYANPNKDGYFFEISGTKNGKAGVWPLTDGATSSDSADAGKHTVQSFKTQDLLRHGVTMAKAKRDSMIAAAKSGLPGAQLVINYLTALEKQRVEMAQEGYKYSRDRADKVADDTKKHTRDVELKEIEHGNAKELKQMEIDKGKFSSFGSDETGYFILNTKDGSTKAVGGQGGKAGGGKIDLGGGITVSRKEARASLADLGKMLGRSGKNTQPLVLADGDIEGLTEEEKPIVLQSIVEMSVDQSLNPQVRSAASNYLKVAASLGYISEAKSPSAGFPGGDGQIPMSASHATAPAAAQAPAPMAMAAQPGPTQNPPTQGPTSNETIMRRAAELEQAAKATGDQAVKTTPPVVSSPAPANAPPPMSVAKMAGNVVGTSAKTVAKGALDLRDSMEQLGRTSWWKANAAKMSEEAKQNIAILVGSGQATADAVFNFIDTRVKNDNKSFDEAVSEFVSGFNSSVAAQ